jgi:hypothetical protein
MEKINNCRFSSWYPQFKHLSFKSNILPLDPEFVAFLLDDSFVVEDMPQAEEIQAMIAQFETCFIKLNWSSPKDSRWISFDNTLKCRNLDELVLLLKSSDFIAHDLKHAYDACDNPPKSQTYELVFRKWYDLRPDFEFRCFVKCHQIFGISQRDPSNFYPHLVSLKSELQALIVEFFELHIRNVFPDQDYVFDIYINPNNRKVWIVDFNPFSSVTDSLLFDWSEIAENSPMDDLKFLVIEAADDPRKQNGPDYHNRVPLEALELSKSGNMMDFLAEFQNLYAEQLKEN